MKKKTYNFKVGECWDFELVINPSLIKSGMVANIDNDNQLYYYEFLIIAEIRQNHKTFWVGIKNRSKKPADLWPIIIDKYGNDRNKIGAQHFSVIEKSNKKSRWDNDGTQA